MEKMIATTRRMIGLRLPRIMPGTRLVWLLLGCLCVSGAIFLERLAYFHRASMNVGEFLAGLATLISRRNFAEALQECVATRVPAGRVIHSALLRHHVPREQLKEIVQEAGQLEVPRLERFLGLLNALAHVGPLIGLLGTLIGRADEQARAGMTEATAVRQVLDALASGVKELAEDLRRYLADEAILARRASVFSDVRRFARRNKVLVGAAAMVLLSLVGAVMVSTRFALDEQAQRIEADAMVDFMRRMLSEANPVFAQANDGSVRELLERADQQLEHDLANAPAARGRIRATLALTFKALGELERSLAYYRAAQADFAAAGTQGIEPEFHVAA